MKKILNWTCPTVLIMLVFQVLLFVSTIFTKTNTGIIFIIFKTLMFFTLICCYSLLFKNKDKFENSNFIGTYFRLFTLVYLIMVVFSFSYTTINRSKYPIYIKQDTEQVSVYEELKYDFEEYNKELKNILGTEEGESITIDEKKFRKLTKLDSSMHRKIKSLSNEIISQELNESSNYLGFMPYFKNKLFLIKNQKDLSSTGINEYYEDIIVIMSIKNISMLNGFASARSIDNLLNLLKTVDTKIFTKFKVTNKINNLNDKLNIVVKESLYNDYFEKNKMLDTMLNHNSFLFVPFVNKTVLNAQKFRENVNFINYYEKGVKTNSKTTLIEWIASPIGSLLFNQVDNNYEPYLNTKSILEELNKAK